MHSFSSQQNENFENIDEFLQKNPTQDEKNVLALKLVKTSKVRHDTYPIERLLNNGVSPNLQDNEGKSLLMIAAERGSLELVQLLIDFKAEPSLRDRSQKTALFYGIEANHENVDVVSSLLSNGANSNHEASDSVTPLLKAVEKGYYHITKILLERGGNVHSSYESSGDTVLHVAVRKGDEKLIELLFENGCNPYVKNKKKQTPLDLSHNKSPELFQFMQNLTSRQKVNQSNIIKTAIETPLQTDYTKGSNDGKSSAVLNFINQGEKETRGGSGQHQGNNGREVTNGQDPNEHKKQKQQQKKQEKQEKQEKEFGGKKNNKDRHESPSKITRSNYFPGQQQNNDSQNNNSNNNGNRSQAELNASQQEVNKNLSEHDEESQEMTTSASQRGNYSDVSSNLSTFAKNQGIEHFEDEGNPYQQNHQQGGGAKKKNINQDQGFNNGQMNAFNEQQQQQMQYGNQMGQQQQGGKNRGPGAAGPGAGGNMHPSQMNQMKSPMPPQQNNYYGQNPNNNPNFIQNQNNPNAFSKKKGGKAPGQGNMKNFPNQSNPMFNPNAPQNFNQNQYNQRGSGNFTPQELNPMDQQQHHMQMSPTNNNPNGNKFNKGQPQGKQFFDKNTPRQFMNPNAPQNTHINLPTNLQNLQNLSHVPQNNGEVLPNNSLPPGIEPFAQQENKNMPQSPVVFNNNQNMHQHQHQQQQQQHHSPYGGLGMNNFPPQYPFMHPNQQGSEGMGQMFLENQGGFHMMNPQNNFQMNNSMSRDQQIHFHPMMNKSQMQQKPNFQNPNQNLLIEGASNSQGNNVKTIQFDFNNDLQKVNMKLKSDFFSVTKVNWETNRDLERIKQENSNLRTSLEKLKQAEQRLQEMNAEKEAEIEDLTKKAEDLENSMKNAALKSKSVNREDSSMNTDPMFANFQMDTMTDLLKDPRGGVEFVKPEYVFNALHEEIISFEKAVNTFNLEKKTIFDSLLEDMKTAVNEAIPEAEWEIYGSFATGLCLPWSDIDIVIRLPQITYGTTVLEAIESNFRKKPFVDVAKVIKNTSVPVLKITCSKPFLGKKVDISTHDGRHNGALCVELVREYLACYPALKPMVLILKQFLHKLNLNDTYMGGLSSYGLILMIVYLFQTRELRAAEPIENQNLGNLLLSFLQFYGFEFDYYTHFVVCPRKITKPKEKPNENMDNLNHMHLINMINSNPPTMMEPKIVIQDPMASTNNVGRCTFNIKEIKNAFMAAYFEAFKPCVCGVHRTITNIESLYGSKNQHICTSIFKKMMFAYHPQKL